LPGFCCPFGLFRRFGGVFRCLSQLSIVVTSHSNRDLLRFQKVGFKHACSISVVQKFCSLKLKQIIKYKFSFFRFLGSISPFLLSRPIFSLNYSLCDHEQIRKTSNRNRTRDGRIELISHLYLSRTWIFQVKNDPLGNIS